MTTLKMRCNDQRRKPGKCDVLEVKYPKQFIGGKEQSVMLYSTDRPGNMKKTETWSLGGLSSMEVTGNLEKSQFSGTVAIKN